jgi:hypothetical protein
MLKRYRKYYCRYCKRIIVRMSDKQWIKSQCVRNDDRDSRLMLVKDKRRTVDGIAPGAGHDPTERKRRKGRHGGLPLQGIKQ